MEDLLPSKVRECGTQPHAHRLFDIVIRRKGNADGGVLAMPVLTGEGWRRDSDGLAFS
jgi:hypothetical protein